jgi:hypothetical protein
MLKYFMATFVFLAAVMGYVGWYGFNFSFPPCIYTEEDLPVPEELRGVSLAVERDAYVVHGSETDLACSPTLGKVPYEIINKETVENVTIGKQYFERQGRSVGRLEKGKKLKVERMIASTKHGISTIDSGSGPTGYLILSGEDGSQYALADAELGWDFEKAFMGVWSDGRRKGWLTWVGDSGGIRIESEGEASGR